MNSRRRFSVLGLVIILLVLLSLISVQSIVLGGQDAAPRLVVPLWKEKTFTIEYLHSVNKTPVREHFIPAPDNKIVLTATEFRSLGVGTPFLPEEGQLVNDQGVYSLTGMNRSFEKIHFVSLPLTKHTLILQGKEFPFGHYFKPGETAEITIEDYSLLKLLIRVAQTKGSWN